MKFFQQTFFPWLMRHLAGLGLIVLATLLLRFLQPYLAIQLIALLYLLPVILSTMLWGLTSGVLACFGAFLTFNYFFIQPYHTFEVHQTQDVITLVIFLLVSVMISQLIGQAREGLRLARSREWEATRLYALTSALAGLQDSPSIARTLAGQVFETFGFERVEVRIEARRGEAGVVVEVPPDSPQPPEPYSRHSLITTRSLEGEMRIWTGSSPAGAEKPHSRSRLIQRFFGQTGPESRLARGELSPQELRLLATCLSQGALALERIRLARSEVRSHLLEESDRLKSSLLNSVSHELRSPLAAIKASVSSLRSGAVDWSIPARSELLATIEEETDHLNALVGNLLDMSRIESGALKPQRRWTLLSEIALSAAGKLRKMLQDHRLETNFCDGLPLVPVDYIMIEQVFNNLISNSAKYAPPGTTIRLNACQEGDWLHVQVTNQSKPVPEEHLERIFDKFYRVTDSDRVTGTGLGLSICKGIVEAHGGKIWAANEPNCFAFHFTLPLTLDGALPQAPKENSDG